MGKRVQRPLAAAIIGLAIVIAVIIVSGLSQRRLIVDAFGRVQEASAAQRAAEIALRDQLDMETGIRGYAATRDLRFLEPYDAARARYAEDMDRLRTSVRPLDPRLVPLIADMQATNARWNASVAIPTIARQRVGLLAMQREGKSFVDHYRADILEIETALEARDRATTQETRGAIDRIVYAVLAAVLVVVVAGILYSLQQARLATEAAVAEEERDAERRRSRELGVLYAAEKRIADTLQDAIAQRPLPTLPSLRFSATYVPALEESKVGGDWYDALELPGNRVLFAIGDVAGHGLGAAVAMSRARQALVTSALLDADPATVLARVNDELLRQKAPMVTAVVGYADATTFEFVFAVAGHPPPLLVEPGRKPRFLACGELPLGVMASSRYQVHRVQTVPGAMLVLYTDGAVEHTHDVLEGEEILLAAAQRVADGEGGEPSTAIHEAIFHGKPAGDDVAILTVGFASEPATGLRVTAESMQASVAGTLSRVRHPSAAQDPLNRLRGRFVPHGERKAS